MQIRTNPHQEYESFPVQERLKNELDFFFVEQAQFCLVFCMEICHETTLNFVPLYWLLHDQYRTEDTRISGKAVYTPRGSSQASVFSSVNVCRTQTSPTLTFSRLSV